MKRLIEQAIELLTSKTMCLNDMNEAVRLLRLAINIMPPEVGEEKPVSIGVPLQLCEKIKIELRDTIVAFEKIKEELLADKPYAAKCVIGPRVKRLLELESEFMKDESEPS